jgi:hypothetical protein
MRSVKEKNNNKMSFQVEVSITESMTIELD